MTRDDDRLRLMRSHDNDLDDDDDDESILEEDTIALRIKSFRDVEVQVARGATVAQAKKVVRAALGSGAENRYMRLICKGRLLAPDTAALHDFTVDDGDVLHAVLAASGVRGGQQAALARGMTGNATRRYRGTGIGPGGRVVRSSGSDSDEEESDEEEGRERLGFDRLRSSGLSRHEITAIRSYFSRDVDRFVQAHPDVVPESIEPDALRRRMMQEDAWMQTQGPASEFRLNLQTNANPYRFPDSVPSPFMRTSVGTDRDFMWGFLLGFFVGFLMLVWVWMPTVPHKQKLGILTGISFQLAMSLLRDSSSNDREDFMDD